MKHFSDIFNRYSVFQFIRYVISGASTTIFLFCSTYFLVDILRLDPRIGYFIAISLTYALIYFISALFVFKKEMSLKNIRYFLFYVLIFWALNNISFNIILYFFKLNHLVITAINIVLFLPLRFFSQKYFVFKDR